MNLYGDSLKALQPMNHLVMYLVPFWIHKWQKKKSLLLKLKGHIWFYLNFHITIAQSMQIE